MNATTGKGGGVEIRAANYKGKLVLFKGHVPILTAKYPTPGPSNCGPYRDWLFEESKFTATNPGVTNGIALNIPGQSILETGTDVGNFKGVTVWTQFDAAAGQNKMVFLSELQAGWYRYIHKWTFYDQGQMVPEFGFEATQNACSCNPHVHHPYWRLDFDIEGAASDKIWEYSSQAYKATEFSSARVFPPSSNLLAAVQDSVTQRWVNIWAGGNDGTATNATLSQNGFAVNDWWGLAYSGSELYDGVGAIQGTDEAIKPKINNWVTGQNVNGADVVIWYGAHFFHDPANAPASHYVGPTLVPSW